MRWFVFKLFLFFLLLWGTAKMNTAIINGPLQERNAELAKQQLDGKVPASAGDFQVHGSWFSFNAVYEVEVLSLVFIGFMLFVTDIIALTKPRRHHE